MTRRIVLSIDGGGVRGIVPAIVLNEILFRMSKITRDIEPLHKYFDLVVGTSAGAIVASSLVTPKLSNAYEAVLTPDEIVNFFKIRSREIFPQTLYQKIRDMLTVIDEKYDSIHLERILENVFHDTRVSASLTNVVYTAYDIETRSPVFITNISDDFGMNFDMSVKDAVRASTAAPTYFEPARVLSGDGTSYQSLIDGGVFMNDPALAALHYSNVLGFDLPDVTIISLGTGSEARPYMYHEVKNWGIFNWISPRRGVPLLSILMSGQSMSTRMMLDKTLNRDPSNIRYIKIDDKLSPGNDDLDDSSDENISELEVFARSLIKRHDQQISYIAQMLCSLGTIDSRN
jgi:patatin-like phospholipase/acyl hydrolase